MNINEFRLKIERRVVYLKKQIGTLYFAYRDINAPLFAKIVAIIVVAYALSPVDLIPDFIPILGYVDDMILLPLGIALAIRLIPNEIIDVSKVKAEKYFAESKKSNWIAGSFIILLWITMMIWIVKGALEFLV